MKLENKNESHGFCHLLSRAYTVYTNTVLCTCINGIWWPFFYCRQFQQSLGDNEPSSVQSYTAWCEGEHGVLLTDGAETDGGHIRSLLHTIPTQTDHWTRANSMYYRVYLLLSLPTNATKTDYSYACIMYNWGRFLKLCDSYHHDIVDFG